MQIPLEKRLRKRAHREIGFLQDEVLEILYSITPDFVLHGGTAIWRCYGGGRFSDDLDLYHPKPPPDLEGKLRQILSSRSLALDKFKKTANLIFCKIRSPEAEIRLEVNFAKPAPAVPVPYEKMDGSSMIVLSLPPDALLIEKAQAYLSRKLIRDIYDAYFLSLLPSLDETREAREAIAKLCKIAPAPLDEDNLAAILFSGAVPKFGQILAQLRSRSK